MVRSYNSVLANSIAMTSHHHNGWQRKQRSIKNLFRTPSHRLFGNPLCQLSTEEDLLPKPIQVRINILFHNSLIPSTNKLFGEGCYNHNIKF